MPKAFHNCRLLEIKGSNIFRGNKCTRNQTTRLESNCLFFFLLLPTVSNFQVGYSKINNRILIHSLDQLNYKNEADQSFAPSVSYANVLRAPFSSRIGTNLTNICCRHRMLGFHFGVVMKALISHVEDQWKIACVALKGIIIIKCGFACLISILESVYTNSDVDVV